MGLKRGQQQQNFNNRQRRRLEKKRKREKHNRQRTRAANAAFTKEVRRKNRLAGWLGHLFSRRKK